MGQRRNAESVRNFVIFLLILQNCGQARTQLEIELNTAADAERGPDHESGTESGRGLRNPQAQMMWQTQSAGDEEVVLVTSPKPLRVVEQLHQDLAKKRKHTSTVKPFNILQQLVTEQAEQLRQKRTNVSFNILEALQMEQDKWERQTTTVKPFRVVQQLQQELEELQKHTTTVKPFSVLEHLALQQAEELRKKTSNEEEAFEVLQPVAEPLEEHKAVPAESTRAKDSQKRKRKRIRRRRKRKRKRGKRKRKRTRKKRKKKRKKRKKKKGDKDKKKKRKKRRKKPTQEMGIIGQQAHLIYANPTKQPYHSHNYPYPHPQQPQVIQIVTTKRPTTPAAPFSKIKYLLRHNNLFKKKKKEWFNHVGHVLYPFVKFVAFFTILNPFTLGVFLFTLISPAVFGFLGFVALSVLVKPFLHLVFGVKDTVGAIDRKRYLANKRAEQLKLNLRPVTIHKHYYQQKPLHSTPPHRYRPVANWRRQTASRSPERRHNPLLPADRAALAHL
ncbi:uncharacterized protein LOC117788476 [Drosophila innubila]|uniref:uncharacterized protein LOC117788476 n=1 Tax=Drosophila innubila TaxID=198719 RepID=UPI00148DEF7F|nr:uncharacterized protein LOC117788476 [Drosophila innubila]